METSQIEEIANKHINKDMFTVKSVKIVPQTIVDETNHLFMIGAKHISHASDNYGGMLGEETCREIPCEWKGCKSDYESHQHMPIIKERILFLQLKRNLTSKEASDELKKVVEAIGEGNIIGVSFVETSEKYKIT